MTNDERRLVREGFGFIEEELRLQRATGAEILKRLDVLIRLAGGTDAKATAVREDHDALAAQVQDHERRIRKVVDSLPVR